MNIGFDLDKIFIDTPPLIPKKIIEKLYKKKDNGVLLYRIPSRTEQIFRMMTHWDILRQPLKENLDFLESLPKDNNKFYLISSRFKFLEKKTQTLIKKYNFDKIFSGMYFNFKNDQPHLFKNKIISDLKLDLYIDDDLSLLEYVAKHNPKTKFFWLDTKKDRTISAPNIKNISNLSEIIHLIK